MSALHSYFVANLKIARSDSASHPNAVGRYFNRDDLHILWRHAEGFEIPDDRLVERALGRQSPAGKHGNLDMGVPLARRSWNGEALRRMLDQPQNLVVFGGVERLYAGTVDGVEKLEPVACDPPAPNLD